MKHLLEAFMRLAVIAMVMAIVVLAMVKILHLL